MMSFFVCLFVFFFFVLFVLCVFRLFCLDFHFPCAEYNLFSFLVSSVLPSELGNLLVFFIVPSSQTEMNRIIFLFSIHGVLLVVQIALLSATGGSCVVAFFGKIFGANSNEETIVGTYEKRLTNVSWSGARQFNYFCPGDMNGDNVVDVLDVTRLLDLWGRCCVPWQCNDGDPCTLDSCGPAHECVYQPIVCAQPPDPCFEAKCAAPNGYGQCVLDFKPGCNGNGTSSSNATYILADQNWRGIDAGGLSSFNWTTSNYNDSSWLPAVPYSPFSCPSTCVQPSGLIVPSLWTQEPFVSVALRRTFVVEDLSKVASAEIGISVDDDFILFVNGFQVGIDNNGFAGPLFSFNITAIINQGTNVIAIGARDSGGCKAVCFDARIFYK